MKAEAGLSDENTHWVMDNSMAALTCAELNSLNKIVLFCLAARLLHWDRKESAQALITTEGLITKNMLMKKVCDRNFIELFFKSFTYK